MSLNCECEDAEGGSGLDGDTLSQARLGWSGGEGRTAAAGCGENHGGYQMAGLLVSCWLSSIPCAISISSRNPKENITADPACPSATNHFQTILEPPRVSLD